MAYKNPGMLAESIKLFEGTVAAHRKILGDEHPETLSVKSRLAALYREDGRLDNSIDLLEATVEAQIKLLGIEHADTTWSINELGTARREKQIGTVCEMNLLTPGVAFKIRGEDQNDIDGYKHNTVELLVTTDEEHSIEHRIIEGFKKKTE